MKTELQIDTGYGKATIEVEYEIENNRIEYYDRNYDYAYIKSISPVFDDEDADLRYAMSEYIEDYFDYITEEIQSKLNN